jgi:hypothetical protein
VTAFTTTSDLIGFIRSWRQQKIDFKKDAPTPEPDLRVRTRI